MNIKPLWVEKFLDDKAIFELFQSNQRIVETSIPEFEHCIDLEKRNVEAKEIKLARSIVSSTLELIVIQKRLLQRLEQSKFLPSEIVEEHRQRLQQIQDKAREITIRENLK